jgi:hypothetical protein
MCGDRHVQEIAHYVRRREAAQVARVGEAESSDWWLGPVPLRLSNSASMGCQRKPRAEPSRTLSPQPGNSESIAAICSTSR